MPVATCLMHAEFEGLGIYEYELRSAGYDIESYLVPKSGVPPSPADLLIILGGPMSANSKDSWVSDELACIRNTITAGKPVLGINLGAQLIARALGGSVYKGPKPEIGMTAIHLTPEGRNDLIFGHMEDPAEVFEWHSEGVEVPPGAVVMAKSADYPVQAFRYGPKVVAMLFHPEIDRTNIDHLCAHYPADIRAADLTSTSILQKAKLYLPVMHRWARLLLESMLNS